MQKKLFYERTKQRIAASVLIGMLAAILTVPHRPAPGMTEAWWGVLYPQYCCSAGENDSESKKAVSGEDDSPRVKIRFRWLHGF